MTFRHFSIAVALLFVQPYAAAQTPADIPAAHFAELPGFTGAKLSPDGKYLAYLYPIEGRWFLVVHDLATQTNFRIPPPGELDYRWLRWANDHTIVYSLVFSAERDLTETTETRLIAFDVNTKENKSIIIPAEKTGGVGSRTAREKYANAQFQDDVIDWLPNEPYHVLVALDEDQDGTDEVRRVDIRTGKFKIVQRWASGVQHYMTDQAHSVRVAWGINNIQETTLAIKTTDGEWVNHNGSDWYQQGWFPQGFSSDPELLYVAGIAANGRAAYALLNTDTGDLGDPITADPNVDMGALIEHPWTGQPFGISYMSRTGGKIHFLDDKFGGLYRAIGKALPGTANRIASVSADERKVVVVASSEREAGMVLIWDRNAGTMDPFGWYYQQLDPEQMSPVRAISYEARDGTLIPGFMTVPLGTEAIELPAVVLPHGGPHARDDGSFDYLAQFLASRGYLVLQPNFRGSTGYGAAFESAGRNQWGGLMQDDVDDGAQWLIDEGYAEADRVAIAGWSYGGYSAAMGLIKSPDLYQCGVGINGVYNLPQVIVDDQKYIGGSTWVRSMGLDGERSKSVSPVHRADDIEAPFLIIQSEDDVRVQSYNATDLARALDRRDKPHKIVMVPRGGHSMFDAASRETVLIETEQFLASCLGGD